MIPMTTCNLLLVDRRIGGLENRKEVAASGEEVDRRIGGLEIIIALSHEFVKVDRRIGGLEIMITCDM